MMQSQIAKKVNCQHLVVANVQAKQKNLLISFGETKINFKVLGTFQSVPSVVQI